MTPPVFLLEPGTAPVVGSIATVSGDEGRHAVTVRRLTPGAEVELVDGRGTRVAGTVAATRGKDVLQVQVDRVIIEPAPTPRLIVVQALPKGERGEVAVETLTEVGVDVVVPWAAERCVSRWQGARAERGVAKWRRTSREATKQARRSHLLQVRDLATTPDVAALAAGAALAVVLQESASAALRDLAIPPAGDVVLVVGPEGGISDQEAAAFAAAGAHRARIGPTVLRTSTAGTVAAAVVLASGPRWA